MRMCDFSKFKFLIIYKQNTIQADIQLLCEKRNTSGFRRPMYLRMQKILGHPYFLQMRNSNIMIIFASYGLQHPQTVQLLNYIYHMIERPRRQILE
ncbi:hypothetical protein ASC93_00900 [Massilia sp. Root335]|nr:hypothetical protein ASC93_00900 [Massilia sp. Root335]